MGGRQSRLGPIHIHPAGGGGRGLAGGLPHSWQLCLCPNNVPSVWRPRPGTHSLVFLVPHPSRPDPGAPCHFPPPGRHPPGDLETKGAECLQPEKNETHTASSPMPTRCQPPGSSLCAPRGPCERPGGGHGAPAPPRVSPCMGSLTLCSLGAWLEASLGPQCLPLSRPEAGERPAKAAPPAGRPPLMPPTPHPQGLAKSCQVQSGASGGGRGQKDAQEQMGTQPSASGGDKTTSRWPASHARLTWPRLHTELTVLRPWLWGGNQSGSPSCPRCATAASSRAQWQWQGWQPPGWAGWVAVGVGSKVGCFPTPCALPSGQRHQLSHLGP